MHFSITLISILLAVAPSSGSPPPDDGNAAEIFDLVKRQSRAYGCGRQFSSTGIFPCSTTDTKAVNIYTVEAQDLAFNFASNTLDRTGLTVKGTVGKTFLIGSCCLFTRRVLTGIVLLYRFGISS